MSTLVNPANSQLVSDAAVDVENPSKAYFERRFCLTADGADLHSLKVPEAHVKTWEKYAELAEEKGLFTVLRERIPQFWFPIKEGISEDPVYADTTRRGWQMPRDERANGFALQEPEQLKLLLYESLAGTLPILITGCRSDFVSLMRAFTCRNEPKPIPDSMGACMLAGFNNWNRIHTIREVWETKNAPFNSDAMWRKEFKKIIPNKSLYQDRFMVLSRGDYSAVPARKLGLTEAEWARLSLAIRLEHECTHFFSKRLFNTMENHVYDELIADFMGVTGACGSYKAEWFLNFLGLERFPTYREGGRLQNYFPEKDSSPDEFRRICEATISASKNLERYYANSDQSINSEAGRSALLLVLSELSIVELADPKILSSIPERFNHFYQNTKAIFSTAVNPGGIVSRRLYEQ